MFLKIWVLLRDVKRLNLFFFSSLSPPSTQFPAAYCTRIRRYGFLSATFDLSAAFYIIFLILAFESISGSLNPGM